jgi:PAS domain S-box-containing protein
MRNRHPSNATVGLERPELLLAAIVDSSEDAILSKGLDGTITSWNAAAERMFGYAADEIVGESIHTIVPPDRREEERSILARLKKGEQIHHYETIRQKKDGQRLHVMLTVSPVRGSDHTIVGASNIIRDISERRRVERELRESREEVARQLAELEAIYDTAPLGLCVVDRELRFRRINRRLAQINGAPPEAHIGKTVRDMVPGIADQAEAALRNVLETGKPMRFEIRGETPAHPGEEGIWDESWYPLRDPAGQIIGLGVVTDDVTEQRSMQEALRHSELRYRELFESIDEGFCIIEMIFDKGGKPVDYRFLECNPAFERHTGLANAEGKTMREMVPHHDAHWFEIYGRVAHLREPERFESYSASLERWFGVYAFPVDEPAKHRVALIFNNITDRKEAQQLLERTVEERTARLRETISELEAFSYSLSHDLRAPLRAIQGFAMVAMEECGDCSNEHLQTVIRAAQRMDRLIQDVLSYSKVSRQELKVGPVDTELLLREIVRERPELQAPRAELVIQSPLLPVMGHDASLTQCFTNLMDNAVKFVRPGQTPRVEITSEPKGDFVKITIKDNGIGISEHSRRNLFGMFFRASHGYEGTGMGLAIVKRAVERMGGQLGVESIEGQGSCFWIELPSVASKMVAAVRDSQPSQR